MDTQHSPGGKSHVCSKCGWNYPNPHPSAKNRRAHKKNCGTIKGFEILGSDQSLDLQKEEHCFDDEQKTPSPRVVKDERIGDISEEDVFADAVCEFSSSLVSDSIIKEKEEETAAECNPGEPQHCNKSPEVVQERLDVLPPVQVREADTCGESSPDSMVEQSHEAQVIHDGLTISNVGLETEGKGNVADESESMLASALGKRVVTSTSSWNDEVIYSDLEGPHGFSFSVEEMNMNPPGEADSTVVSDKNPVDTPPVETIADQVIDTTLSALDALPLAENDHLSLHGTKGLEDKLPSEDLSIGMEVPLPDKLPLADKTEPQDQTSLVALPSAENIVMPKIDPAEDNKMNPEEGEPSFGASQEAVVSETVTTLVDPIVAGSKADVSHSDLIAPEIELIQANVVAEENNSPISELSSQSSSAVEHYVSPVSVALEGDVPNVQNKSSTETSKDSILQIGAEAIEITEKDDCTTPNQKLLEKGRTEPNRVVGGLGVIQANEIDDGNVKAHNIYAEVPVTIESNDHRDFGRLQNLSEAQIRSLVLSPLVTRDNTSNAISGHSEPENGLSKNQEITTSWSTGKEEHVPLKNLLNEARSPRLVAAEASKIQRVSSILDQETSPDGNSGWPERREVSEEWNSPAKYPVERKVKGKPFWVPFVCCSSSAK
ncbi:unnamed protein product [Eruca vesicaria subsp. sativa]|uniref:Uncharacterized protein n=1 Tax=Eruca vesicaria subsp. sativa TaxID=29727 RepID=A0ABC8K165_ERUVS|nr:unnamed protein product [Eruca vesicaria subsp. sativa]